MEVLVSFKKQSEIKRRIHKNANANAQQFSFANRRVIHLVVDTCSPIGILRKRMSDERRIENDFDFLITSHKI